MQRPYRAISAIVLSLVLMTGHLGSGLHAQTVQITDPYRSPTAPGLEWCLAHLYLQSGSGGNIAFLAAGSKRGTGMESYMSYIADLEAADPMRDLSNQGARRKQQFIEQQLVRQFNEARRALGQPASARRFTETLGASTGDEFRASPAGAAFNKSAGQAYAYADDCISWIDNGGLAAKADERTAQARIDDLQLCAAYYGAFAVAGERGTSNQSAYAERYVETLRQAGAAMGQDPRAVEDEVKPLIEITIMQMVSSDMTLKPSGFRSNMSTVRSCDSKLGMGDTIEAPALRGVKPAP